MVERGEGAGPRAGAPGGGPVRWAQGYEGTVALAGGRAEGGVLGVVGEFGTGLGGDGGGRGRTDA
ncbi:hypothetical protein OHS59_22115 [Streptomyces sp. NBC_00414]|uniref:hypothetical protein n=1 Tax=Streptomyces sp. NBC_00414 TaxID=2975739 RepID=UPI002E24A450